MSGIRNHPGIIAIGLFLCAGLASAAPVAVRDRVVVAENGGPITVDVLANDAFDVDAIDELRVSSAPAGEAVVDNRGTLEADDDRIAYSPPTDFSGRDVLSYEVCEDGGGCAETQLDVVVRPSVDRQFDTATGAGFADVELSRLRDLPDVMFATTALAGALVQSKALEVDPTPLDPWDGTAGTAFVKHMLPLPSDRWRVLLDARGLDGDVDVYMGIDANGNAAPDPEELLCTAAMSPDGVERCELEIAPSASPTVQWWALFHNRHDAPQSVRSEAFEVSLDRADSEGGFVATGPGDVPRLLSFPVRVAWQDYTGTDGTARVGYVRVVSEGEETGVFPVRLDHTGDESPATLLGLDPVWVGMAPHGSYDRLFIDVPEGATELLVEVEAEAEVDLYVGPGVGGVAPDVGVAPAPEDAVARSETPGGSEVVVVAGDALTPGPWFARVENRGDFDAYAIVQATVTATAPTVRSGSYYNPGRSGHGVFLYPAADQRTGLWYTYFQDRSPTWYYLQASQPEANGIWSSPLFRAAWDGDSRELVQVGRVVMTPTGPDRFTWSYTIDGETGSETLEALGRGCPTLDGDVVDASGTWFDPEHAGTGYSTQFFPDYEFYAAFVYDALGVPRFVVAERGSFGDADEAIDLEQLRGFCPLCERTGNPERETIGLFSRSFGDAATLESMAAAGLFTDGVDGAWSQDDDVQLLGGPGSTQGCDP